MPKPRLTKLRGKKLFGMILRKIKRNPECWDQEVIPAPNCGSAFCIGGLAVIAVHGKRKANKTYPCWREVMKLFRLTECQTAYVFSMDRTLPELEAFYKQMKD